MTRQELAELHPLLAASYARTLVALDSYERCWALYENAIRSGEGVTTAQLRMALMGDEVRRRR